MDDILVVVVPSHDLVVEAVRANVSAMGGSIPLIRSPERATGGTGFAQVLFRLVDREPPREMCRHGPRRIAESSARERRIRALAQAIMFHMKHNLHGIGDFRRSARY